MMQNDESQSYIDRFLNFIRSPSSASQGGQFTAPQATAPDAPKPPLYDNSPTALQRILDSLGSKVANVAENPAGAVTGGLNLVDGKLAPASSAPTFDQAFPPTASIPAQAAPVVAAPAPAMRAPPAPVVRGALEPSTAMPNTADTVAQGALSAAAVDPAFNTAASATQTPATAAAPRKTLMEMYQDLINKVPKDAAPKDTPLTDEQKNKLRMDFFLNMMSSSMKPGAYALGAIGDAGKATSGEFTTLQDKNRAASEKTIQQQRDDAFKAIGLMDKDQDNQRLDRKDAIDEQRWKADADYKNTHLQLLRDELNQGKTEIQKTARGMFVVNKVTGKSIPMVGDDGRPLMPYSDSDHRSETEKTLEFFGRNPKAFETWQQMNVSKTGAERESDAVKNAITLMKPDAATGDRMTAEDAMDTIRRATAAYHGAPASTAAKGPLSRKDPRYTAALQDPRVGGDKAKLDAVLKGRGWSVTD